ncbi:iron chelate uptake ABC transporter family permease subunit [Cerasicoccus arenae]|uniref:Manganese ABC transporter permease n=1 Tax=Cerasicoccus arenae TaxID=424488 RepID=A0A8J3DGM4_9BACT|nr:iron chelate uptake ABC transporter family permease subunit [Cerasicoccus arenae]MBK1858283.1 metal ABC transporter permease [Cerasicoccus arenae]GHB90518.1 manganese ABC transporter permease [Cerasicoccus arenae]
MIPPPLAALTSLHDTGADWPSLDVVWRVLTLQDYNTRLVVMSTMILGLASGLVGCFLLLRKRSLMGDALSHATLPGIGLAFIVMASMGGTGKHLVGLLVGATVTGVIGVIMVLVVRNTSRIKDDAAMGIVLSVFFGLGMVVLSMVLSMPSGHAAGLESFIYGKTASMIMQDFLLLSGVAAIALLCSLLLLKEFTLLCFDEGFGRSQGWPIHGLDIILLGLVALVTVVGLQAVGLILIIAFLITPAAAARFWTNDLRNMLILSALIGGVSGWCGASISALLPRLPAGAVIVLVAAAFFVFSLFFGKTRGVVRTRLAMYRLKRKVGRQHLLRAVYEIQEAACAETGKPPANIAIPFRDLLLHRSWSPAHVRQDLRRAKNEDHIDQFDGQSLRLSESGFGEAARITRNHRLWEIFLITHADIAASHVDRDADSVEHVLSPDMVRELEQRLDLDSIPESPHYISPQKDRPHDMVR